MAERCDTAAVLGAGVMGAGIAAHFAGAGIRTHLPAIDLPKTASKVHSRPNRLRFMIRMRRA
jgi:3-hydroxyacyl-CoA dehydrogenase